MKKHWLLMLLVISTPSWAVDPFAATPAEEAMCQARVYSRLGPRDHNTMHMHHYCTGLRFLNRAYAATNNKKDMRFKAERSISNFNYVLRHTQESYAMRGEVHLNKAQALKMVGRKAEAMAELNNALRYDAAAGAAYQALADSYLEMGNRTKALEMATEGLKRNPDSKVLQRRYTELGGKLPYPARIEAAAAESQATEGNEVAATPSAASQDPSIASPAPESSRNEAVAEPKIGSPTNPYCRFCPD